MISNIKRILKKNPFIKKTIIEAKSIVTFDPNISEITPFNMRKIDSEEKRINILVPSINQEHLFGGISTALKFYEQVADFYGYKRRIITTDASPSNDDLKHFKNYTLIKCNDDDFRDNQIVPFNDRYNKSIPVSKNDIFISTAWWTAYATHQIIKWQSDAYNQDIKKSIYFIQDFEPGFYQWSSRYALADSTYKSELPQIAVFNSKLLYEYFKSKSYKFDEEYFFEPTLNDSLKKYLLNNEIKIKEKKILIYGRPSVHRNAFEVIVEALKLWVWKQEDIIEWEIYSIGEKHPDIELGNGAKLKSLGKLTIDGYAQLMSKSYCGISLMISPHPSYPPLEMSTFGMKVITNSYENKELSGFNENILSIDVITPENISNFINYVCTDYKNDNFKLYKKHYYMNNVNQFKFISDIMI